MLTNHSGDEFLARNQYQNALQSLQWQIGNYTAWMNGTESNFTLLDTNPALHPLVESLLVQGIPLDPQKSSYYSNITGFLRGEVDFHNITHQFLANSSISPGWSGLANELMSEMNETEGHIEFLDANSSEELRLDFEGIHFVTNGSVYGFAEPQGRNIDIRLLPSIVPPELQNTTAHAIVPQLESRITRLKNLIDAGIIDQDIQSAGRHQLLLDPTDVPSTLLQELEEETQKPTGKWTVPAPKLSVRGVVVSQECGLLYEMKNTTGLRISSHGFFRKVTTYAGFAAISYLTLLVLLSRQMDRSRTPAGISRVTRWSFLTQSIVDSVSFAGHITFAILADGRPSLSLVAPAFLACVLFVNEAAPEDNAPTPVIINTPPNTAPPTPSITGPTTPDTPGPTPSTVSPAATTTAQQPSTLMLSLLWSFLRDFLACPKNVLDVDPRWWSYLLALFMSLQVVVILLQEHLGPAFFLPQRFHKAQTYDYHPPMSLPDPESPEQSLGDCAICMDAIILEGSQRRRKSVDQWSDRGLGSGGGGLLNAVQMGVGGNGARKNYSLAPCHHLFHTACLERWLAIKNIWIMHL
ncbi:hypothetical protein HWV62_26216 [Athelia sp. TMB]|nr:hypothetical protein HWV62_26216 [Athelia sp. TMB]